MLVQRAKQILWTLDHELDLRCDFRAFLGVRDPMRELTGPEYFAYAVRMSAYSGVMAARAAQYEEKSREQAENDKALATIFQHGEHVEV